MPVLVCSSPSRRWAKASCSVVGERLVAEHEDRVLVHAGADLGERLGVGHLPQVDGLDLGGERGMERAEPEGHADILCDGAVGTLSAWRHPGPAWERAAG